MVHVESDATLERGKAMADALVERVPSRTLVLHHRPNATTGPEVEAFVTEMKALNILPECECFDTGIVRSIPLYQQVGLLGDAPSVSFVMGVASGMPAKPSWLPLLIEELPPRARWQVIAIGREDVWPLHRAAAERGGHLRTGLELSLIHI